MNEIFAVHRLNGEGMQKADQIAFLFDGLLKNLEKSCPKESQYFSLAKQKLEAACFYAKKSMATLPKNQLKGA